MLRLSTLSFVRIASNRAIPLCNRLYSSVPIEKEQGKGQEQEQINEISTDSMKAMKAIYNIQKYMGKKLDNVVKFSRVVTIGGQSTGKTSLINSIVGIDILFLYLIRSF